jgi:hypothetical protein
MPQQRIQQLTLLFVALGALLLSEPSTALAAALGPGRASSSSPSISAVIPRTVTPSSGPQREVFGFALASSLSDSTVGYPTWDFSLLSTVAFFGLHVRDDGTFASDSYMNVWNSSALSGLVSTAHSHATKVVLTIILQDFSAGTPNMCAGLSHGSTTISNAVSQMKAKGVDGINVDYEGLNGSCGTTDSSWARHAFTSFIASLHAAMPGYYLSVDTYASSAVDPYGFFDTGGLAPSVDSFFVMAYDLEYSNYSRPPISCSSFCLGPTAPLGAYYYNDSSVAAQYTASVGASKVILGVPYYGRKACVANPSPNSYPTGAVTADTYLDASQEYTSSLVQPGSYTAHRDIYDAAGAERWDTWVNTSLNCVRELYWDDTVSLGHKYALVNQDGLRGLGIWNLNYGGGAPELWALLNTYFECPVSITLPAIETSTEFPVDVSTGSCSASKVEVQVFDSTLNQGWFGMGTPAVKSGAAQVTAEGYKGHTYQFRARAYASSGIVSAWTVASTAVSTTATMSHPFNGLYTLDGWGGINADSSPPLSGSAYWPGWNIARAAKPLPGASSPESGAVLDGYGGLHPYGVPTTIKISQYWAGWDIARDFAYLPDGSGGVVLDGWGGLHPFHVNGSTNTISVQTTAYWPGWDIARKVVIFADGTGGYVMDAWGGLHPFGINGPPPVSAAKIAATGYWPGWSIARDVVLVPGDGGHSGYVLDGWGGVHPFHVTTDGSTMPAPISTAYWSGWDIARGVWLLPGSATAGYTLDGWGGVHPFGGAPPVTTSGYWPGWDIARGIWGA